MKSLSFGMRKEVAKHSLRLMLMLTLALTLAGLALPRINGTVLASDNQTPSVFLEPPFQTASVNGTATVAIKIKNVDNLYAAEVHLNFPADLLEVQDFDPNKDGIQIAPSSDLFPFTPGAYYVDPGTGEKYYYSYSSDTGGYFIAQSEADNTGGTISYRITLLNSCQPVSAGSDGKVLATITFKYKAAGTANINFINPVQTEPSVKLADAAGSPVTVSPGDIHGAVIGQGILLDISIVLQGGSRPDPEGWVVPITVKFFTPGANVLTDSPLYEFNLTTSKSDGTAACQCSVPPDTYDITAVSEHTLMNVRRNVVISAPSTSVDMGPLFEGNANDDIIVDISDFGILALSFMELEGNPGYDARADFDRNGIVDISDFGLLALNFMEYSPVECTD